MRREREGEQIMREILFTGKRVDNGEWVYGSVIGTIYDNPELLEVEK